MNFQAPTLLGLVAIVVVIAVTFLLATSIEVPNEFLTILGSTVTALIGIITANPFKGDNSGSE